VVGLVALVFRTKRLAFRVGLRQCRTDIIWFSHEASGGKKADRCRFIPGPDDRCMVFEETN
jgi:hypothetical protein